MSLLGPHAASSATSARRVLSFFNPCPLFGISFAEGTGNQIRFKISPLVYQDRGAEVYNIYRFRFLRGAWHDSDPRGQHGVPLPGGRSLSRLFFQSGSAADLLTVRRK